MASPSYRDGYEVGARRGGDLNILRGAVSDCEEMGWSSLADYFRGKIAGVDKGVLQCDDCARDAENGAKT